MARKTKENYENKSVKNSKKSINKNENLFISSRTRSKKTNVLNDALIWHEKENSKKKQSIKKQLKIQSFHLEQQDQQKKSVE